MSPVPWGLAGLLVTSHRLRSQDEAPQREAWAVSRLKCHSRQRWTSWP